MADRSGLSPPLGTKARPLGPALFVSGEVVITACSCFKILHDLVGYRMLL